MTNGFASTVSDGTVRRAQAGEMAAHAALFECFGPAVLTLARRLLKRRDIADEILQETFLDVMRRIGSYRGEAPIGFWIRQIALNRSLMFLRSSWERDGELLEAETMDERDGFASALDRADLESLLDRLPPVSRAVLWLHEVEGYTHQEIAGMLGRTPSFSKSQLVRTHTRLRAMVLDTTEVEEKDNACQAQ